MLASFLSVILACGRVRGTISFEYRVFALWPSNEQVHVKCLAPSHKRVIAANQQTSNINLLLSDADHVAYQLQSRSALLCAIKLGRVNPVSSRPRDENVAKWLLHAREITFSENTCDVYSKRPADYTWRNFTPGLLRLQVICLAENLPIKKQLEITWRFSLHNYKVNYD